MNNKIKFFIYAVLAVIIVLIGMGFYVAGSPMTERIRRFDEKRVSDLQFIQNQIVQYFQAKEKLPVVLTDLKDDIRGISIPTDPDGNEYKYFVESVDSFKLCGIFSKENLGGYNMMNYGGLLYNDNWGHMSGEYCFVRKIDKELYPPFSKTMPQNVY